MLMCAPKAQPAPEAAAAEVEATPETEQPESAGPVQSFLLQIVSIALAIVCWGSYGPVLHSGQAAMHHSRLRPLLCVGLAYFAIAVIVPNLWLAGVPEASEYNFWGTIWSLAAGAAGAIGALGIIMAFNFGGRPVYVMPLVFGGAPVVNTLWTTILGGLWNEVRALFLAGLILVIAGAAMVLVFAPKGSPPGETKEENEKDENSARKSGDGTEEQKN